MGGGLPKAVETIVVERHGGPLFRVGMAEMNGWRQSMEDAHVVTFRDNWGFFGVFDGHGGAQCSAFVAKRLTDHLRTCELPKDDSVVKALMLGIDKDFLDSRQPSGSTGTFVYVEKPPAKTVVAAAAADAAKDAAGGENGAEGRHVLRVGNIGDSRVLLGRMDGTIVEGPGTDGGLTTDHKPDYASERERIERCGGTVQMVQGVARVNGDLAVSRAFGDAPHKETGGPAQEDHPVSAEPEFTTTTAGPTDFVVLVCDGISEGNFPNREVIELIAEGLRREMADEKAPDLGQVAAAVCKRAIERGSMDNLSCMIVLLSGGEVAGAKHELIPGPFAAPEHSAFRKAYEHMAERAGFSLVQAVEKRYDDLRKERVQALTSSDRITHDEHGEPVDKEAMLYELREELAKFGGGPPMELPAGSKERTKWFQDWLDDHTVEPPLDLANMSRPELLRFLSRNPEMLPMAQAHGVVAPNAMRSVQVSPMEKLKPAVENHAALKWDERLTAICGQQGRVLQDDISDGTSQVQFPPPLSATAWLPTSALVDLNPLATKKAVRVCPSEELKKVVESHDALRWHDDMAGLAGTVGEVLQLDVNDETTQIDFKKSGINAWLPNAALTELSEDEAVEFLYRAVRLAASAEQLQTRVEAHPALKWNARLADVCGQRGWVLKDDGVDNTSQVKFRTGGGMTVWLPTDVLEEFEERPSEGEKEKDAAAAEVPNTAVEEKKEEDAGPGVKRQKTDE